MHSSWLPDFELNGFVLLPGVLPSSQVEELRQQIELASGGEHSLRGLLDLDWVCDLARSRAVRSIMKPILGERCFAVRGLFFDKILGANWLVPPHQDLSIAVEEHGIANGFGPWSRKQGVVHVHPPRETLENMATIRLHLDDCDESNGALRVMPGSHLGGKLNSQDIAWATKSGEVSTPVPQGGAMIFRPLLVHASSPSAVPTHRRVIHLEFAASELPDGLNWRWKV